MHLEELHLLQSELNIVLYTYSQVVYNILKYIFYSEIYFELLFFKFMLNNISSRKIKSTLEKMITHTYLIYY